MMRRILVVIAILASGACERGPAPVATPPPTAPASTPASPSPAQETVAGAAATPAFADRVWLRSDPGSAPGAIQVFASDGTLLADSCFETYRLSQWRVEGDRELAWSEGGIEIRAAIVSVDANELVLRVGPGGGEDQHFRAATVPYVCPDMPR
jgi:hypothetical protein